MSGATLEEVQIQETLLFSETIKVTLILQTTSFVSLLQ